MRVTLIGHASVLVELGDLVCLMDPVLFDPFEEGVVSSYPQRLVDTRSLPPADILIVSHRHPDHFDIRSLAALPRNCQVLCPPDPLIAYALKKLGFNRVSAMHPGQPCSLWDVQLYPTPSQDGPLELGLLFHDGAGTFWNQVDTLLSLETIRDVRARFPGIDLLFARYASQNFDFFEDRSTEFPYEEHQRNLETVLAVKPKVAVPGSAGFQFHGEHAWLNRFLFPISPERFVADLGSLAPDLGTETMEPGDVAEVAHGEVQFHRQASPAVHKKTSDPQALRFDPTAPVPPLEDPNPSGYAPDYLERTLAAVVRDELFPFAKNAIHDHLSVPFLYRSARAVYGLEVVMPWTTALWEIDFRGPEVTLRAGTDEANVLHRIAGSILVDWMQRKRSFFSVRVYSRRFSTAYRVSGDATGVHAIPPKLPDLLIHYVLNAAPNSAEAAKQRIDAEIERYA